MELKKTRLLLGGLTVVALGTASLTLPSGASETPTGATTGTLRSQSVPSSNDMFDTAEADEFLDEEFVLSADCDAIFEALDGLDGLDWTP
ncbi:MAG: hypothetical protein GY939_18840, partial [Actinomycetia bacterium]|nr:hypothetical protein [Actinomycetes bacterium]